MSHYRTTYCIDVGKYELECDVYYMYTPGDPGVRYYPDGSGCPPTSPKVELIHVNVYAMYGSDEFVINQSWFIERGWDVWINDIASRIFDDLMDDTNFYHKLIDEIEDD